MKKGPLLLATALIAVSPMLAANLITNGSFENVSPTLSKNGICVSTAGHFYSVCSAADWTGFYQIGNGRTIGRLGSSFDIPQPDPDGSNALILQGAGADATQVISVPTSGLYTLTFYSANRSGGGVDVSKPQTLEVLLNNTLIQGATYTGLPYSWTEETLTLDLSSGTNSLTFETTHTGDRTDFVDAVSLVSEQTSSVPEPSSLTLLAVGCVGLLSSIGRRHCSLAIFRRVTRLLRNNAGNRQPQPPYGDSRECASKMLSLF